MNRSEIIAFLESQAPNAKAKDILVRLKRDDLHEQLRRDAIRNMDQPTIIAELRKLARRLIT
ncbi:hypothetical protein SJ05684_c30220 [Sinorhizobium sojae CCBAU 05684]|uniref:Uncharacterized protein n=1 Tax=Sinorhizobium sojae CCBAU 05684 TaxID=716928 RepID=A0A249PF56_9HYPH|nr:hypothetical protein [Sinorhizobium sojae]ASY64446.1 hypothetical protein SJ05684_c30220 [Sinorhizobium sojae CCBAU 05684]